MISRKTVENSIRPICSKYGDLFSRVILFGSFSRNEQKENSDLDLYIESSKTTGKTLVSKEYRNFVYDVYDASNKEFDFITIGGKRDLNNVRKSMLYQHIIKDGIVLYDKESETEAVSNWLENGDTGK